MRDHCDCADDYGFKFGDIVLAFDNDVWNKIGKDGDLDMAMKRATIVHIYKEKRSMRTMEKLQMVADVRFHHRDEYSRGHYLSNLRSTGERA